jgi:hypothetical protein
MCRNFTYEVVGKRSTLKATIKNCTTKLNVNFNVNFLNVFPEFYMKPVAHG